MNGKLSRSQFWSVVLLFLAAALPAWAAGGDALLESGAQAFQEGRYEQTVADMHAALEAGLDQYEPKLAYAILGNAYAEMDMVDEAIAAQEKALELDPRYHIAWVNLGVAYRLSGDFDKAEQCYKKALEIEPEYAELHASLGALYVFREQPEKAVESLQKAIGLDPSLPVSHANLALAYAMLKRFDDADRSFARAIDLGYKRADELKERIDDLKALSVIKDPDGAGVSPPPRPAQ